MWESWECRLRNRNQVLINCWTVLSCTYYVQNQSNHRTLTSTVPVCYVFYKWNQNINNQTHLQYVSTVFGLCLIHCQNLFKSVGASYSQVTSPGEYCTGMSCKIHWTLLYCTPICVLQGIPPRKLSLLSFTVPNPHTGTLYRGMYSTVPSLTIINQITPYCTSFFRFEISPFDCFEAISSAAWLSSVRFSHPYITATNPSISKSMIEREKLKSPPSHQCEDLKWIEYCMYCTGSVDRKATCELHLRYQSVGLGWICSINSTTLLGPS